MSTTPYNSLDASGKNAKNNWSLEIIIHIHSPTGTRHTPKQANSLPFQKDFAWPLRAAECDYTKWHCSEAAYVNSQTLPFTLQIIPQEHQKAGVCYMSPLKHHFKKALKKKALKIQALGGWFFFFTDNWPAACANCGKKRKRLKGRQLAAVIEGLSVGHWLGV